MKHIFSLVVVLLLSLPAWAQRKSTFSIIDDKPDYALVDVVVGDLRSKTVATPQGNMQIIQVEQGTPVLKAGAPDVPRLAFSLIIPPDKASKLTVVESEYTDIPNVRVAPSKGKLYRNQQPADVPYVFGDAYQKNAFYPAQVAVGNPAFVVRDFRGQTIHVYPVQYNPITRTLRVYHRFRLRLDYSGQNITHLSTERPSQVVDVFDNMYERRFINYKPTGSSYTPLSQTGRILVLCPQQFLNAIQPYVAWKSQKGFETFLVNVDTLSGGLSDTNIYQVVSNYYQQHQIAYVLLVGDHQQLPTRNADYAMYPALLGPSDNAYTFQTGNDHYPDLVVGRFSGISEAQIQLQVNRTLKYEQDALANTTWMQNQVGMASDQGPGDDWQMDYEHIRGICDTNVSNYNYLGKIELYDGSQGGNDAAGSPVSAAVVNAFNDGVGLVNYCGHGSTTNMTTSGFAISDVSSLTNTSKWPVMVVTACLNGNFANDFCLAEALLRAGTPAEPTGAAATMMSTILQSWDPPMQGQDEFNAILRGNYPGNKKSIFGAMAMDACMSVNEAYNDTLNDPNGGNEITDTWTIFGDPNLEVRTKNMGPLTCSHTATIGRLSTWYSVSSLLEGTRVGLYYQGKYWASGYTAGGSVQFTFPPLTSTSDTLFITGTLQNYLPYRGYVRVVDFPSSIASVDAIQVTVFPNPATDELLVEMPQQGSYQIGIYDVSGKMVRRVDTEERTHKMDIRGLQPGTYSARVEADGRQYTKLFAKY
jgi:gingipain R